MKRYELSDTAWQRLMPLLPPARGRPGRPTQDRRRTLNAILWIVRTGAPWRDLPERYGPWRSAVNTFGHWRKAEVWTRVLGELQRQADAAMYEAVAFLLASLASMGLCRSEF